MTKNLFSDAPTFFFEHPETFKGEITTIAEDLENLPENAFLRNILWKAEYDYVVCIYDIEKLKNFGKFSPRPLIAYMPDEIGRKAFIKSFANSIDIEGYNINKDLALSPYPWPCPWDDWGFDKWFPHCAATTWEEAGKKWAEYVRPRLAEAVKNNLVEEEMLFMRGFSMASIKGYQKRKAALLEQRPDLEDDALGPFDDYARLYA